MNCFLDIYVAIILVSTEGHNPISVLLATAVVLFIHVTSSYT